MASPTQPWDRSPEFDRFWWGEAVSGLGSAITFLALQTVVLVTLQGSAAQVGWLTAARWLPYLVLGLVVGALVDRVRRRPVMVVTDVARCWRSRHCSGPGWADGRRTYSSRVDFPCGERTVGDVNKR